MLDFGSDFKSLWPNEKEPNFTDFQKKLLLKCKNVEKPQNKTKISEIIRNSENFPIEFPIDTCRVQFQPKERYAEIEEQINSVYPIIHERVLWLYSRFLEHKVQYGNKVERDVYSKLDLIEFVQRLLIKRSVCFFARHDKYLLVTKETGTNGHISIGTLKEEVPLILKNCLSYDEIKLAALLSVSSHTEFINDGSRTNVGVVEPDKSKIERSGVIIGLIGARLVKRNYMETEDILITREQNVFEKGYGEAASENNQIDLNTKQDYRRIWKDFYEENDFLYRNVKIDHKRFIPIKDNSIFDAVVMKKRYTISFDTLLLEAQARAAAVNKLAYIHVVGIGLGVWKCCPEQENVFVETFAQRLQALLPRLNAVSVVHFSYFDPKTFSSLKHGAIIKNETHPSGGIKILISKRNPHEKLKSPELENCLPIISYAWDGNALPGNEFWLHHLKSTGDPAAACSTLITELHNPHINVERVSGQNLHIASEKYGVIHIAEYVKKYFPTDASE